jgi:hypothetical protein
MTRASDEQKAANPPTDAFGIFRFVERWVICYLFIYILPFPLGVIPCTGPLSTAFESSKQSVVVWLADSLFSVALTTMPNGSGDTTYNYFEVACMLGFAAIAALVSCVALYKLPSALQQQAWLRIAIRYYLATAMLGYGWHKLFPIQFSPLGPEDMISTYGDSSPMGLLWRFMGASTAYQMFAGAAEIAGGLLLLSRRTTLLGAVISGGVLVNVVLLNLCFDVPVKLYSSHLLLIALWIMSPDYHRLFSFFVLNRVVEPNIQSRSRPTSVLTKFTVVSMKAGVCFSIAILPAIQNWQYMFSDGNWKTLSARHGVYWVDSFERNGVWGKENDDDDRWVRVGISDGGSISIQFASGRCKRYRFEIDENQTQLKLSQRGVNVEQILEFKQIAMTIDGYAIELSGVLDDLPHRIRIVKTQELSFFDSREFHWINEFPLNR